MPEKVSPPLPPEVVTATSEASAESIVLPSPIATPHPVQVGRPLSKRTLFTFGLVVLIILSGSGLFYLGFGLPKTPTLSSAQTSAATVAAATATVAAQAYATATTRQGVMFGFDAAHTNHNPYEQTLGPGNVSQLTPLWSFATKSDIFSPTIAGGMVYVGSGDGKLYAFDGTCRKNCQPLWSFAIGKKISSPAVAGGMVYVGSENGGLYAFGLAA